MTDEMVTFTNPSYTDWLAKYGGRGVGGMTTVGVAMTLSEAELKLLLEAMERALSYGPWWFDEIKQEDYDQLVARLQAALSAATP